MALDVVMVLRVCWCRCWRVRKRRDGGWKKVLNERHSTGGRHSTITSRSRGEATRRLRADGFVPPDACRPWCSAVWLRSAWCFVRNKRPSWEGGGNSDLNESAASLELDAMNETDRMVETRWNFIAVSLRNWCNCTSAAGFSLCGQTGVLRGAICSWNTAELPGNKERLASFLLFFFTGLSLQFCRVLSGRVCLLHVSVRQCRKKERNGCC